MNIIGITTFINVWSNTISCYFSQMVRTEKLKKIMPNATIAIFWRGDPINPTLLLLYTCKATLLCFIWLCFNYFRYICCPALDYLYNLPNKVELVIKKDLIHLLCPYNDYHHSFSLNRVCLFETPHFNLSY